MCTKILFLTHNVPVLPPHDQTRPTTNNPCKSSLLTGTNTQSVKEFEVNFVLYKKFFLIKVALVTINVRV